MRVELFKPHKVQEEILTQFVMTPALEPNPGDTNLCHWGIASIGRQFGKSLLGMNSMLYWALSNNNSYCVWMTPYDRQGEAVFDELTDAASDFILTKNRQDKKVVFKNNSTLLFRSLENYESIRGYTFDYGVIDECAFVREEAWAVVRPTFAVNGKKVLVISTPKFKDMFYKMFMLGKDPDRREYISFTAPSTSNPYFPNAELEAAREILTRDQIRQEYFAEFAESGGGVFDGFDKFCTVKKLHGDYRDERCYIGVDIALGGDDFTSVVVMNQSGKVINVERWQDPITSRQIARIQTVIESYDIAGGFIEMNQERGISQAIQKKNPLIKPFETTKKTKPQLIQNLKKDIEDGVLALPTNKCCPSMYHQLGDFTKEEKANGYIAYSHPKGGNDDDVIGLALANEARDPNRYNRHNQKTGRSIGVRRIQKNFS